MGGADVNGGNKPHPATQNPMAPCDGERPGCFPLDDFIPMHRPAVVTRPQKQVAEPAGYAVAGKIFLAAAGALAGVLLAIVAMYLYNSARRRRLDAGGGRRRLGRSPAIAGAGGEDRDDGTATPRGLDPAVLCALPVVAAGQGAGDCAVCLAEVQPGEKARALLRCAHMFHADCIDAWFRGNATCPLCRADVVAPPPEVRVDVDVGVHDAAAKASVAPAAMETEAAERHGP